MIKILRYVYFGWITLWFLIGFVLFFPLIYLILQRKKWHPIYFYITKTWAVVFYGMIFSPIRSYWHFKPTRKQAYIYCPNHFSYLDIPLLTRTLPSFFVFVGLHDLEKIPLFGYMYRKIHIPVNRANLRNKYLTYQRCKEALTEGKSLVIFPEGGIWTTDFPKLSPFKEGPFRIAIELQIPIVPVTIPYNWKLMPLLDIKRLRWYKSDIIFHPPIDTTGMTLADMPVLKQKVYQIIKSQLEVSNGLKL